MPVREKGVDRLKKLTADIQDLQGRHSVPFEELFDSEFIGASSTASSVTELLERGGYSAAAFDELPTHAQDAFVRSNTKFETWQDMCEAAVKRWTTNKLGL